MKGTFYGVGVGPGDPELMTLKAVRIIKECDIIVNPSSNKDTCLAYQIASQVVSMEKKIVLEVNLPMTKDKNLLKETYDLAAERILPFLESGKDVAMLTIGDPTIYSTIIYIQDRIEKSGFETRIINGVTSFCAASAVLNQSLAEREESLHIYPGSYDIKEALSLSGTKVFMKSASKFHEVKEQLKDLPCEFSMVENCGLEQECMIKGIGNFPEKSSYYTIIIAREK